MRGGFSCALVGIGLALSSSAVAIPPALPSPDQFEFSVEGVRITCRLPQAGGPLTGCMMQDSLYLLSLTMQRLPDGNYRYDVSRTCLEPGPHTQGFEFAHRNGVLAPSAAVAGSALERDLRTLLDMRIKRECEGLANWPHQISQLVPRYERAYAVFRSLRFE